LDEVDVAADFGVWISCKKKEVRAKKGNQSGVLEGRVRCMGRKEEKSSASLGNFDKKMGECNSGVRGLQLPMRENPNGWSGPQGRNVVD